MVVWKEVSPKYGALLVLPKHLAWPLSFILGSISTSNVCWFPQLSFVDIHIRVCWPPLSCRRAISAVCLVSAEFWLLRKSPSDSSPVRVSPWFWAAIVLSSIGLYLIWYGVDLKFPADFVAASSANPLLSSPARVEPSRCLIFSPAVVSLLSGVAESCIDDPDQW